MFPQPECIATIAELAKCWVEGAGGVEKLLFTRLPPVIDPITIKANARNEHTVRARMWSLSDSAKKNWILRSDGMHAYSAHL